MSTIIFSVEFRLDSNRNVYKHFLAKAGGDQIIADVKVKQAISESIYEMLEKKVFPTAKGGGGE